MLRLSGLFIAFIAISSFTILLVQSEIGGDLKSIDKILVDTVNNDDLEENLKAINQILNERLKKGVILNPFNTLTKTLSKLDLLARIRCDADYLNILKEVNDAFNYESQVKESKSRIGKVLYELLVRHAKECPSAYYHVYKSKVVNANRSQVQFVSMMYDFIIHYKNKGQTGWLRDFKTLPEVLEELLYGRPIAWYVFTSYFKQVSKTSKKEDIDSKYGGSPIGIYRTYLKKPCTYYVKEFGPEVFDPASFDAESYHDIDESESEFYAGWARYKLCRQFLDKDPEIYKDLLLSQQVNYQF